MKPVKRQLISREGRLLQHHKYSATERLQDGDLVLFIQFGFGPWIIEVWTHGPYSHCGVIRFRNGKVYVIEATYKGGVIETPLQDYVCADSITLVFVRILNGVTPITMQQGKDFADEAYSYWGAGYDVGGFAGFIRVLTHHIFKFLPLENPWDDPAKFWCAELVRTPFEDSQGWDFLVDIPKNFESPNSIVKKKPDGTMRVTVI